jgi:hypothetical protein
MSNDQDTKQSYRGLLKSIDDITTAKYFTSKLSLSDAAELASFKGSGYMYEEARKDALEKDISLDSYLATSLSKATDFIRSKSLWDREELMESINSTIQNESQLTCILGGKSTGKSFLLSEIERQYPDKVYIVDMRGHDTILGGLIYSLKEKRPFLSKLIEKATDLIKVQFEWTYKKLKVVLGGINKDSTIQETVEVMAKNLRNITIVIDEANIPFTIPDGESTKKEDCQNALDLFVKMTKQQHRVKYFIITSLLLNVFMS